MGPITRARELTETLKTTEIVNQEDYETFRNDVSRVLTALHAAWANPAVELEAARAKNELLDAWHAATESGTSR